MRRFILYLFIIGLIFDVIALILGGILFALLQLCKIMIFIWDGMINSISLIIVLIFFCLILKWLFYKKHQTPLNYKQILELAEKTKKRASDYIDVICITPKMDYQLQREYWWYVGTGRYIRSLMPVVIILLLIAFGMIGFKGVTMPLSNKIIRNLDILTITDDEISSWVNGFDEN